MGQSGSGLRGPREDDGADDVKRQVDLDDSQKAIYQLVNVKNGGGKLVDLIKSSGKSSADNFGWAAKSFELSDSPKHSEDSLEKQIHELVEPLLYNGGRGKLVSLSRIWAYRLGKAKDLQDDEPENSDSPSNCRWVCWKLEERGFVGETALHICFLLSTPTHMIIARKLLAMFPKLINDIYTCDEYFGESSLHMAIVNENVRIVKLLLDHGASVHERCLGSFFIPNDQKDKTNGQIRRLFERLKSSKTDRTCLEELESIDLERNHFSGINTNYDGYVYWGEYPLSFAICLGLPDCYKLLLAKGANPNRQDSNGNSSLHMAVIANRMDMFDLCFSSGADLSLINHQNLSPLTLAARLHRVEMLFHILAIQRQINWIFCNVGFVEAPLKGVDSVNITDGSCDEDSVLSIVVFGNSNEHLRMLDGLLNQLLQVKWQTSAGRKFYWSVLQFLVFMAITCLAYITRLDNQSESGSNLQPKIDIIRGISEIAILGYVSHYLLTTIKRIVPSLGFIGLCRTLAHAPEVSLFTLTCLMVLTCVPLRLLNLRQVENFLSAIIMFTLPLMLLFFCRASKSIGPFVVMIYKILVNDVLCFVAFLIIFVAGFSQSFLIIFKTHKTPEAVKDHDNNYFTNLFDALISMHMMALNEFGIVFEEFNSTDYPLLAKVLFCAYMVIASILLMNMLIAMLGKTYQDVASQPNENLRQWARALLILEHMWTSEERLSMMERYSHVEVHAKGGENRYYGSTWALEPRNLVEINSLKKLGADNEKNSIRLSKIESEGNRLSEGYVKQPRSSFISTSNQNYTVQ